MPIRLAGSNVHRLWNSMGAKCMPLKILWCHGIYAITISNHCIFLKKYSDINLNLHWSLLIHVIVFSKNVQWNKSIFLSIIVYFKLMWLTYSKINLNLLWNQSKFCGAMPRMILFYSLLSFVESMIPAIHGLKLQNRRFLKTSFFWLF